MTPDPRQAIRAALLGRCEWAEDCANVTEKRPCRYHDALDALDACVILTQREARFIRNGMDPNATLPLSVLDLEISNATKKEVN